MFSLFNYNQSNRIDIRIEDGTVKITTILTVRAMLTSKKTYSGRARNKSRGGGKIKNRGAMPPPPPAGDAPGIRTEKLAWPCFKLPTMAFIALFCSICRCFCTSRRYVEFQIANSYIKLS